MILYNLKLSEKVVFALIGFKETLVAEERFIYSVSLNIT